MDSQQLADVTRFRDALGPGTLPLLKTLFDKASGVWRFRVWGCRIGIEGHGSGVALIL